MAINPNTVNILNVSELQDANNIQNDDLLIIGQGIYARKSTILNLYNKFSIDAIKDNVTDLQQKIEEIELLNPVLYTPQLLNAPQQQTARDNIKAAFADDVADLQGLQFESDQATQR